MTQKVTIPPAVLCFSGHDPSGGAGTQADIESLMALGCHCCPVVTAITVQDTTGVTEYIPTHPELVSSQAKAILEDINITAIKIGMTGSIENIHAIHAILLNYPHIPVVLDPVLSSGRGDPLNEKAAMNALCSLLLPLATLATPNSHEARAFVGEADTLDACAQALMDGGCEHVLITGSHENTPKVLNRLWGQHKHLYDFSWPRLPRTYHGSGCTLAAATAGLLAHELDIVSAVRDAQAFTWNSLKFAHRLGMGQLIPNRLFWSQDHRSCEWRKQN